MRIIANIIYFLVFLVLAIVAMFLGGVSGVAGTFYLMVEPGDFQNNLTIVVSVLVVFWLLVILLRQQNMKVMKRNQQLDQKADEKGS